MYNLQSEDGLLRREWLRMTVGGFGSLLLILAQMNAQSRDITFESFVSDLTEDAERLFRRKIGEESYVTRVANLIRRIEPGLLRSRDPLIQYKRFSIMELSLTAGRGFRYHDHRDYNSVTMVLSGQIRIKNFEIIDTGVIESNRELRIRQTRTEDLQSRQISTLTTGRDNIHDIRALGSTRLLDIATRIGPNARSVYLDVDESPIDKNSRVFRAAFRPE